MPADHHRVGGVADAGLFRHCLSEVSQQASEARCGGWFLNMNPKRPSVVGLWVTRSIPRSSAPCGGMGAGSAAAAGAIQGALTAVPSEARPLPRRLSPSEKGDG